MGCNSSKGVSETSSTSGKAAKGGAGRTMCGTHLKTPEDLVDWPQFPEGTKSLVSKYLTKDIWDKYHDKSDKYGVSFKTCVFSGCQNLDSGIGCYAGSSDSYDCFSDFFDKIVLDYHKHTPTDKHISDMDAASLQCPPFDEERAAMIKSTRIRVGRNLADFALGPGISNEDRDNIMSKVVEACNQFDGDLEGQFYSLDNMDEATQKQLIDDHFLFK